MAVAEGSAGNEGLGRQGAVAAAAEADPTVVWTCCIQGWRGRSVRVKWQVTLDCIHKAAVDCCVECVDGDDWREGEAAACLSALRSRAPVLSICSPHERGK